MTRNPVDDQGQRFRREGRFDGGIFGGSSRVCVLEQVIQVRQFSPDSFTNATSFSASVLGSFSLRTRA